MVVNAGMKAIEFPEQTVIIGKDQKKYLPVPAHQFGDREGTILFCWQLNARERLQVLLTGKLWHRVMTFGGALQPQLLETSKPHMEKP
jgi:hypothetical protein